MRVTIITGGASGIGAAVARKLAGPGQALMLHARGHEDAARDRLINLAQTCRDAGAKVTTRFGDLATMGEGKTLVDTARETLGPIDAIVHAAGFADKRGLTELPRTALDHAFAAMAGAFHEIASAARADLARSAGGRVVAVSSFVAHRFTPTASFPASAAAKAALEVLVRCLAIELASSGATANVVIPGYTRKDANRTGALDAASWAIATTANPMARLATPDDVAALIAFLLLPETGHITGALLPVDGGLALL
jgi:NAD(P)-dependent dehydrogenase (short-subunit alcohol dehydrogenase family)